MSPKEVIKIVSKKVNLTVFYEKYIPKNLIKRTRKEQYKSMKEMVCSVSKTGEGWHILGQGQSGTGKTATVKTLMAEHPNLFLYVSGSSYNTTIRVLQALTGTTKLKTYSELLVFFINQQTKSRKIIVIDDAHKIKNIYELGNALNAIYRELSCPIILITKVRYLLKEFADDAYRTLKFSRTEFFPYPADELKKIQADRLKKAGARLNRDVLECIVGYAASSGSARELLDLTRRAVISKAKTFNDVEAHIEQLNHENWERYIQVLPYSKKQILKTAVAIALKKKSKVTTKDIQLNLDKSPTYISTILSEFTNEGIFERQMGTHSGRGGGSPRYIYIFNQYALKHFKGMVNNAS